MVGREVERTEVVPVVLGLGPFGHLEAEADEHVLQPLPRLCDEMLVTVAAAAIRVLRQVESLDLELFGARAGFELRSFRIERGLQRASRVVEGLADRSA